jgi:hypothetical protein
MDATDDMDSERRGAPKRRGGMDATPDAADPMESDRIGAARRRLGKEMTERPVDPDSLCLLGLLFSESLTII